MKLKMRPLFLLLFTFFLLGNVAACLDDDADDRLVLVEPFTFNSPVNHATVGAIVGLSFQFSDLSSVHPSLTGPITVTFLSTTTVRFSNSAGTAEGTVEFGSCNVTINTSSIAGLDPGDLVVIDPCEIQVSTGLPIQAGSSGPGTVALVLGGVASSPVDVTITITIDGLIIINGSTVGTLLDGGEPTGATPG